MAEVAPEQVPFPRARQALVHAQPLTLVRSTNTYFSYATVEHLHMANAVPALARLRVPPGYFRERMRPPHLRARPTSTRCTGLLRRARTHLLTTRGPTQGADADRLLSPAHAPDWHESIESHAARESASDGSHLSSEEPGSAPSPVDAAPPG